VRGRKVGQLVELVGFVHYFVGEHSDFVWSMAFEKIVGGKKSRSDCQAVKGVNFEKREMLHRNEKSEIFEDTLEFVVGFVFEKLEIFVDSLEFVTASAFVGGFAFEKLEIFEDTAVIVKGVMIVTATPNQLQQLRQFQPD